jgi:hypothetical protein
MTISALQKTVSDLQYKVGHLSLQNHDLKDNLNRCRTENTQLYDNCRSLSGAIVRERAEFAKLKLDKINRNIFQRFIGKIFGI